MFAWNVTVKFEIICERFMLCRFCKSRFVRLELKCNFSGYSSVKTNFLTLSDLFQKNKLLVLYFGSWESD